MNLENITGTIINATNIHFIIFINKVYYEKNNYRTESY